MREKGDGGQCRREDYEVASLGSAGGRRGRGMQLYATIHVSKEGSGRTWKLTESESTPSKNFS